MTNVLCNINVNILECTTGEVQHFNMSCLGVFGQIFLNHTTVGLNILAFNFLKPEKSLFFISYHVHAGGNS